MVKRGEYFWFGLENTQHKISGEKSFSNCSERILDGGMTPCVTRQGMDSPGSSSMQPQCNSLSYSIDLVKIKLKA